MEAVPDIVQLNDQRAEHEEHQQANSADLITELDLFGGEEQEAQ